MNEWDLVVDYCQLAGATPTDIVNLLQDYLNVRAEETKAQISKETEKDNDLS